jgi:hypothetical protein
VGGSCSTNGDNRKAYRLPVGKPGGRRPFATPRRRRVDNIKIDLLDIRFSGVDWFRLFREKYRCRALGNSIMNFRVHKILGNV